MNEAAIELSEVGRWLRDFSQHVSGRDIVAGLKLFANNVDAFGTRLIRATSLHELAEGQWRPTWNRTTGFCFIDESVQILLSGDGVMAVVLALWQSTGVDSESAWGTQSPRLREGRCTIVLTKNVDGQLVAEHTHFSLHPDSTRADQLLSA